MVERISAAGRTHIIKRPRLTQLLDEATSRIVLLVAPPGYGKTTLAREWLEHRRHVWYRGTPASADVAALAVGLAETAAAVIPGAGARLRGRLKVTDDPDREAHILADLLGEELRPWHPQTWLVFDDYHFAMDSPAAESFVERLTERTPIRLLLASRRRPTWATARRILYGEILEIGRNALALSTSETAEILKTRQSQAVPGLQALAEGWPAVIGLAALTRDLDVPEVDVPRTLYEFFAQELFDGLTPSLQWDLCQLAISPSTDIALLKRLFGVRVKEVIHEAGQVGVVLANGAQDLDLHPLLRDFLITRLREFPDASVRRAVSRIGRSLIAERRWDDAFALATRFSDPALLITLVDSGSSQLLEQGRTLTLARWLESARDASLSSPSLDLAEAELHFRAGLYLEAERVALQVVEHWSEASRLSSPALRLAGESAYQMDHFARALKHHRDARRVAQRQDDARKGLWGQFLSALQLERLYEARRLLRHLRLSGKHTTDDLMQLAAGDLLIASRTTGFPPQVLGASRAVFGLRSRSHDPKIRGSFAHLFAHALVFATCYYEGLQVVEYATQDAERHRLGFAAPFSKLVMAAACIGLRQFSRARDLLDESETLSRERSDDYVLMSAMALRARLLINLASHEEAIRITDVEWSKPPAPGVYGDYLGSRAIALACAGRGDAALQTAERVDKITLGIDARAMAVAARAVVNAVGSTGTRPAAARTALHRLGRIGCLDPLVTAYRGCPALLKSLVGDVEAQDELRALIVRAEDHDLARTIGLNIVKRRHVTSAQHLSPREREVHELIAHGLTNRQIANTLFISEPTVKAHVRQILKKLGVTRRTQAALLFRGPRAGGPS